MKFFPGSIVTVILHSPREKLIGVLEEISAAGVMLRGIDLSYFEDWSRAVASGEPHLSMGDYYFPMWRVERVALDQRDGEIPSMAEQFEKITGLKFDEQ
jgi:hypothetical protein